MMGSEIVEREPHYVVNDLGAKLGSEISEAVLRTAMLVDHFADRAAVSMLGSAGAIGIAIRFLSEGSSCSEEELLDALWERMRPHILAALNRKPPEPQEQPE